MATMPVTITFQGKDLISGSLSKMSTVSRRVATDIGGLRRTADTMYDTFVSGSRKARESVQDLGRQVGSAADEVRGLARTKVDDLFSHAKRGAEHFREAASRAGAEVKSLSDARIHIQARDEVSPVLDGIHSKLSVIAATAGGLVIGGGIKDSLFGGITEYTHEAARTAAYLSPVDRKSALSKADALYSKGFFESRAEAAKQVADIAPVVSDRSQIAAFIESSAKMKYITPDASWEEINRALGQATNTFKETPKQVSDSMMYAYRQVGDRQQDLYDTFWEYSGYFKKTGATSAQMSNFLVKSVQEGSFNFDKPADFFKETFGVKALDAGDMAKYFELRGAGKDEAERQANDFVSDINSGDIQKAKGALMALVGDLASQKPDELKASLVALGSATAEDNGDAILKTYKTAFEKPPVDIAGTTDRMVNAQKSADPMQEMIEARRQMDLLMQELGGNIAVTVLPTMQEFNSLLVQNKDEIQSLFGFFTTTITKATGFYKEHFTTVNDLIIGLVSAFAIKKMVDFGRGAVNFGKDIVGAGIRTGTAISRGASAVKGWVTGSKNEDMVSERRRFTLRGNKDMDSLRSLSSMTVHATRVYINGPISGMDRGRNARDELGRRRRESEDLTPTRRTRTVSRDRAQDLIRSQRPEPEPEKKRLWGRVKDSGLFSRTKGLAKGAGVVGAAAAAGVGAYELYQTAKQEGWREAISTRGGSVAGGVVGGAIGGAAGSLLGPAGTMAGAAAGNWVGEKIGKLADTSGLTASIVKQVDSLKETFSSWKDKATNWWNGTDAKKAQDDIKAVGGAAKSGGEQVTRATQHAGQNVKKLGTTSAQSTQQISSGLKQAGNSFHNVSSAAGSAASQTRAHLESLRNISSQGSSWGSNLISMFVSGIRSKFPALTSAVTSAANVVKNFLGFSSPTKEGPASKSDRWAGNFVSMFAGGLDEGPIRQKMNLIAGTMNRPLRGRASIDIMPRSQSTTGGGIPIAKMLNQTPRVAGGVTIQNITMDFGELAKQVTDFSAFAQMMTSPQGRALIRKVFGEELYYALENGG
ncbi:hypothetical protein SAMN04489735_10489 [Aneurinibacillus thermoaerophilus]|uniref:Phage-related minor tail protein n=1 Tax=Aneurinibacillus thermoaerophilus TaxID=143495 RepID=A0A1G8ESX3_ANETH|nr:hypothetical protein [Aneurinibacillus thermoaerophilus]SDH72960.1 hypothetical protein SAMN04489735_10489 [Aneurinibacillus thermoaerophilus]